MKFQYLHKCMDLHEAWPAFLILEQVSDMIQDLQTHWIPNSVVLAHADSKVHMFELCSSLVPLLLKGDPSSTASINELEKLMIL